MNNKFRFRLTVELKGKMIDWDTITHYMEDKLIEQVHLELAPCTHKDFLNRYLELDPDFDIN